MFLGNPEHVADDRDRQPERKILDQVHAALAGDPIDRLIHDLLDARPHVLDPSARKPFPRPGRPAGGGRRGLVPKPKGSVWERPPPPDLAVIGPDPWSGPN